MHSFNKTQFSNSQLVASPRLVLVHITSCSIISYSSYSIANASLLACHINCWLDATLQLVESAHQISIAKSDILVIQSFIWIYSNFHWCPMCCEWRKFEHYCSCFKAHCKPKKL